MTFFLTAMIPCLNYVLPITEQKLADRQTDRQIEIVCDSDI